MKSFSSFSILLTIIALAGCSPSHPKGGVALIDLDSTAKQLGRDVTFTQELKETSGPLSDQVIATQKEYQAELERFKNSLGAKPSEADNQKLAELERKLTLQLQQKQQQAQQEFNAKRIALVNHFREEVQPVALKVATGKGLGVVLVKSELVFTAGPGLDITDEVVAEMNRTANSAPAPASKQKP